MTLRIGIDTGGTFTDLVLADGDEVRIGTKALTTYDDLANGLLRTLEKAAPGDKAVDQIVHGTTVALNAILTRGGAEIGMVTTHGYRDLLDMARGWRPSHAMVDPRWRRPHELRPIVERYRRRTVSERTMADGEVLVCLDEQKLLDEVERLVAEGCRGIAVCFLHAYKHPQHEQRAAELIREHFPDVSVSTSAEVAPFPREYNRFCTCVLNAYVQPLMESYTSRVEGRLREAGISAPLMFMTNDGGLSTAEQVTSRPVATLNSGPVGGVMGVQAYAERLAMPNLVGFDMGGTSTEVAVVVDGRASVKRELEIEHDLLVSLPVVEIHSIGAGGGSLITLDEGGGLKVGPESAGSDPGPACYGHGGSQPTVTDAFLLLGVLDSEVALGGEIYPDVAAAEAAFAPLAAALNLSVADVARTAVEVAIHNMAEAVRRLTVYRGADPREFGLVSYGAAGPLVASQIARALQMERVVTPALSGVFSAFGLLTAQAFEEEVTPIMAPVSAGVAEDICARARQSLDTLAGQLRGRGNSGVVVEAWVDATYLGQRWELAAIIDPQHPQPMEHLTEAFAAAHQRQFGYSLPAPIYVQTLRTRAVSTDQRRLSPPRLTATQPSQPRRRRDITLMGQLNHDVPIYTADDFAPGQVVHGPAVIEAQTYTGVLVAGDVATVNEFGDVVIEIEEDSL
ncbi:hydantoinase/oxoprolinase family protein [Mycobacterium sp. SMC-4]|uniref:hydantoinase/oxoprolinase family protein n=1 Tax=Mycobacterium sp. SMC-4 TaxID=2857059 RepID=UPI0021B47C47|nr:hydantoinase/oxoprolinase family protein [Mycobacterium sp. SMC-4]UXA16565.1 hydantoinase/oxoprolinase family protein [Mycobacterium sp. SMC-4]